MWGSGEGGKDKISFSRRKMSEGHKGKRIRTTKEGGRKWSGRRSEEGEKRNQEIKKRLTVDHFQPKDDFLGMVFDNIWGSISDKR